MGYSTKIDGYVPFNRFWTNDGTPCRLQHLISARHLDELVMDSSGLSSRELLRAEATNFIDDS